ncbi:hypothetical protein ACSCBZ_22560 [Streptomyces niveiscabiei]|uniref:hypothetical protein n=1 Tax=Streptomyces TaxID=1883 RepID=UPI0034E302B0
MNREGHAVARCTVERPMRELGVQGAVRGRRVITTIPGGQVPRAPDLVDHDLVTVVANRCPGDGHPATRPRPTARSARRVGHRRVGRPVRPPKTPR